MGYSIATIYLFMKGAFLFALVRTQVKFEPMKNHWLFLGALYTAVIAFLSYIWLVSWQNLPWAPWQIRVAGAIGVSPWLSWVGQTFLLSALYFRLLGKFDEGPFFWVLLLLGLALVWF